MGWTVSPSWPLVENVTTFEIGSLQMKSGEREVISGVSPDSTELTRRRTSEYRWRHPGNMEMELVIRGLVSQMMEDLRPRKVSWFQERSLLWGLEWQDGAVSIFISNSSLQNGMATHFLWFSFVKRIKANEWKLTENPGASVKGDLDRKPFCHHSTTLGSGPNLGRLAELRTTST